MEKVDAEVVRRVALLSAVELPALSTVFGGVVAQEVVKFTGKFTPLGEFLYLDALLSVPEAARDVTRADDAAGNFAPDGKQVLVLLCRRVRCFTSLYSWLFASSAPRHSPRRTLRHFRKGFHCKAG